MTIERRFPSFRPRCEALEDRTVPAGTASVAGSVLTVTGSNRDDSIVILDDGNTTNTPNPGEGKVSVYIDGFLVLQTIAAGISTINVSARNGNDKVVYQPALLSSLGPGFSTRNFTCSLGNGNDIFEGKGAFLNGAASLTINVQGNNGNDYLDFFEAGFLGNTSTLNVIYSGGGGRDVLAVNDDPSDFPGSPSFIAQGVTANFNLQGGQDRDRINIQLFPELDGILNVFADGNAGNDLVVAVITLSGDSGVGQLTPPTLTTTVNGGRDRDSLTLVVVMNTAAVVTFNNLLDGGSQRDTCSTAGTTPGVPITIVNCP